MYYQRSRPAYRLVVSLLYIALYPLIYYNGMMAFKHSWSWFWICMGFEYIAAAALLWATKREERKKLAWISFGLLQIPLLIINLVLISY